MTMHDDLERALAGWLLDVATPREVELDDVFARTRSMPQRPAWASPGRWLPMQVTIPRVAVPRALPILVVIVLLVAALVVAALIAGSQPRRLPPPFGLAATGLFVYDSSGDLFVANPDGSGVRPLFAGPGDETGATFSRDGTLVAYWLKPDGAAPELWIAKVDGSGARKVSGDVKGMTGDAGPSADWSPTGEHVAFSAQGRVYVVELDAPVPQVISTASSAEGPSWSPDGTLIAYKAVEDGGTAVFVVDPDGRNERRVSAETGDGLTHMWPAWSPDGTSLLYHTGVGENGDVAIARRIGTTWTEEVIVDGPTFDAWPEWSNDGTRISFLRAAPRDHGFLVVANADGSSTRQLHSRLIGWSPHCWTPDDHSIIAPTARQNIAMGDEPDPGFVIVDVAGSGTETFIASPDRVGFAACSWQRLPLE